MASTLNGTGITFSDGSQISANALDAIGSTRAFVTTYGTTTYAGSTISGSYLFTSGAYGSSISAANSNLWSTLQSIVQLGNGVNYVNRTTAFSYYSGTSNVTWSPNSGTWRVQTSFGRTYWDGCTTTSMPTVVATRIS
jgi:hypothetical protein